MKIKLYFENICKNAVQALRMAPSWGSDIDDPAIKKVSNITFRNINAVSSQASIIVFPFKKGMFENISIQDSNFTFLANGTGPKVRHWTSEEYGIINQLGDSDKDILINCKGISADKKPLFIKKSR